MIDFIKVKKSFRDQVVLNDLDLHIEASEINVIIGASGGGKSVLLKHIIGLLKPDSGEIYVDGVEITGLGEKAFLDVRKKFGMLFQDAALFDSMTVGENVAFPLKEHTRLSQKEIDAVVERKLSQVGLENVLKKTPSELSGGMRKRAGLARALALDPKIILFDEPTTGLDPIRCAAIDDLIVKTQRETGATCVVISHDIESTLRIGGRVAMLHQGKIIESGTPGEIKRSANPIVKEFIG
ncbi:toluene transporter subunit: ATP-binding component of ABC superfamily [Candidatus Desulfarcum epimagneticum]|uniref:Toluene transporter subunit: ATP-binding component of ABC superfamily n=1 Tax=uncultured Desulfobacteraceae bacterium TaxID=218296 RepID=A0A484HLZ1_9BACT|nr:toluene transporter subunit: ATP-binding component of ABC superfamily [uncultured Desulfobacteraceae bacterium]